MSLEKLCVFLVAIARYAYEDVVRAADSLVDVGGDDINSLLCLECTGAFYLVSFSNEAYTREKVLRSKQANLVDRKSTRLNSSDPSCPRAFISTEIV